MPHHGDIDGAPGPGSRLKLKQPQAEPERTPVTQIPSVLCLCVSFGSFGLFLGVKHIPEVTLDYLSYVGLNARKLSRSLPVCSLGMITSCFDSYTVVCLGTRGR
jgi:hypothetical protein